MARLPCHVEPLRTILDKMDEKLRPPLPPFQWWKKWRVFVVAREHHWIGGGVLLFLILFCPRLSEVHTGFTRSYLCYADHIWSQCDRAFDNQGKRTLAEIRSNKLCVRFTQNWNKITAVYVINMKLKYAKVRVEGWANSGVIFYPSRTDIFLLPVGIEWGLDEHTKGEGWN